jgi:hypothetical protein
VRYLLARILDASLSLLEVDSRMNERQPWYLTLEEQFELGNEWNREMDKRYTTIGVWEKTPWYFRLVGKSGYRRRISSVAHPEAWCWEYAVD